MKRAAILLFIIATLVMIVSPSAYTLASSAYPTKSGTDAPSVIAPVSRAPGPMSTGGGGGTDQGDADGLSGLKVKPVTQSSFAATSERVAFTMMMWWRYMLLIR